MTSASHEALMKLIADRKQATSFTKVSKPGDGRSRWRILPGWKSREGDPRFYADFGQHFIKDAMGQVKAVTVCYDKTFGRECQVCTLIQQGILNSTDDMTKKRLEEARSNARVLVNALHIDGPDPKKPVILELAPSVFNGKKGVGGVIGLFTEWPTLLNLADGHDIIIERSGTGRDTTYAVSIAGGSKPVDPSVMDKLHDLDKFVSTESEEATTRALTSVRAISGLLPAPGAMGGADRPSTPPPAEAPAVAVSGHPAAPTAATAPAAAPAAAAPAAAPVSTGDPELEKLLADLGG